VSDQPPEPRVDRYSSGGIFWGLLLLAIGVYFLLRDTLNVDLPDLDRFWPLIVILIGGWILYRQMAARR
jgi:hypothetical protein